METGKFATQSLTFQKAIFDSTFKAICAIQDQTEKVGSTYLDQMNWLPEETKKSISEGVEMYKKARENFKKSVDDGFGKLEEMLSGQ